MNWRGEAGELLSVVGEAIVVSGEKSRTGRGEDRVRKEEGEVGEGEGRTPSAPDCGDRTLSTRWETRGEKRVRTLQFSRLQHFHLIRLDARLDVLLLVRRVIPQQSPLKVLVRPLLPLDFRLPNMPPQSVRIPHPRNLRLEFPLRLAPLGLRPGLRRCGLAVEEFVWFPDLAGGFGVREGAEEGSDGGENGIAPGGVAVVLERVERVKRDRLECQRRVRQHLSEFK